MWEELVFAEMLPIITHTWVEDVAHMISYVLLRNSLSSLLVL